MRCSAEAAVIIILGSTFAHALAPLPRTTRNQVDFINASEIPSILLWQNTDGFFVKFDIPCPGCFRTESTLSLEFNVRSTNGTCADGSVSLNGKELVQRWDANRGHGSGTFPYVLLQDAADLGISASWQSICIPPPPNSPSERPIQFLTLRVDRIGQVDIQDNIGFATSFRQAGMPDVLRLGTYPLNISEDSGFLDNWRDPPGIERLETQPNVIQLEGDRVEDQIERESTKLKTQVHCLEQLIKDGPQKIRGLLKEGCKPLFSKWKQCQSIVCLLEATLQTVPELFHLAGSQFGSQKLVPACNKHGSFPSESRLVPSIETSRTASGDCSDKDNISNLSPATSTPLTPNNVFITSSGITPLLREKIKGFARLCVILFLIATVAALTVKLARNSSACRRRRVDLAARREERRARRAYRSAARRLRWRQWWEGHSHQPAQTLIDNHDLDRILITETGQRRDSSSNVDVEQGAMQAEILGLRRVLEFVGELVQNNNDPDRSNRSTPPPQYNLLINDRSSTRNSNPAPSSVVGLTTINSPRSSSLMSLETASSLTVETLESLESAPPAYHR